MTISNTDGKFYAYRQVATLHDGTGRFRANIQKFSELYNWSEAALAETIARQSLPTVLIGPMSREEYDALTGRCIGYVDAPDPTLEIDVQDWRLMA